jgi:3-phenylpropionate/trans-cinnamate dioxygenase ferredoxin subunit
MTLKFAARLDEINDGEPLGVSVDGESIALFLMDGEVFATHNVCTNQFALLSDGYLQDGCIECPLHQGRFDVKTGAAMGAPVTRPIRTYRVQVEDGRALVDLQPRSIG